MFDMMELFDAVLSVTFLHYVFLLQSLNLHFSVVVFSSLEVMASSESLKTHWECWTATEDHIHL